MAEEHAPGTPSVYHDSTAENDPDLTDETPELLSPEQVERRVEAVATALSARGLAVRSRNEKEFGHLRVENPQTLAQANLYLDEDGGAVWDVYADTPEHTPCARIVDSVARALA